MTVTTGEKRTWVLDLGSLLLLGAMVLWFTQEMIWDGKVPFFRDLGPFFYPMKFSLAESFKAGELPLWNRHMAMGFPLLANFQSGVFYLPNLFFLVFSFFGAIRALYVFHYLVAATGSYCLCRRWGYCSPLALIGAILFTFGGYTVSLTNLLNHFQTAVWLPWVLLLGAQALRSKSGKNLLLFALVLLVQFLAGSPEVYVLTQGLFLLEAWRARNVESNISIRHIFYLLLKVNGLVMALGMLQLLPTLELFSNSGRSDTIPYGKATAWSMPPQGLINFFFPDKEIDLTSPYGFRLFFTSEIPWIISLYLGAVALPAVLLWFVHSPTRERAVLLVLVMATSVMAMGHHTSVFGWLYQFFPPIRIFRFPEKFLYITFALVLYMVLKGLYQIFQTRDYLSKRSFLCLLLPSCLWVLLYVLLRMARGSLVDFINEVGITTQHVDFTLESTTMLLIQLERQITLTASFFLVLLLWKKGRLKTALSQPLLVAMVFFDLTSVHQPYQFFLDPDFVKESPKMISSPDPQPNRLFYLAQLSRLHPDFYIFNERPFAERISTVNEILIPNTGIFHDFDYLQELDALARRPYDFLFTVGSQLSPKRLYRLLAAMNVKYISSAESLPAEGITLLRHFPDYPSWLYRIEGVVPRAYIVSEVAVEKDPVRVLERLASDGFKPREQIIIEKSLSITSAESFTSRAKITDYGNQEVTIDATLSGAGALILADSFYPGWKVYVNGKEEEVLRTNYFFRGVVLSAGDHRVVFRYEPASFYFGLAFTLTALLFLLFISVRGRRAKAGSPVEDET